MTFVATVQGLSSDLLVTSHMLRQPSVTVYIACWCWWHFSFFCLHAMFIC